MTDTTALALIQRSMRRTLDDLTHDALERFVDEDPLDLRTRSALVGDDDGHLFDPADAATDGYVELVRQPRALEDLEAWLRDDFPALVRSLSRDAPSPELLAVLMRALGVEEKPAARWLLSFREYPVHDRREVLALLRTGSRAFRELYPGAFLHPGRDAPRVSRAYATLRELVATAVRD